MVIPISANLDVNPIIFSISLGVSAPRICDRPTRLFLFPVRSSHRLLEVTLFGPLNNSQSLESGDIGLHACLQPILFHTLCHIRVLDPPNGLFMVGTRRDMQRADSCPEMKIRLLLLCTERTKGEGMTNFTRSI
jgi:hypothetical protein